MKAERDITALVKTISEFEFEVSKIVDEVEFPTDFHIAMAFLWVAKNKLIQAREQIVTNSQIYITPEEIIEIDEDGVVHAASKTSKGLKSTVLRDPEKEE